ncbi:MAG: hypothetical protein EZS28_023316 [Streblomastix strix]|uniref:Uncharacterized protein n=1 Tax=Streblomastix strix TaxID=222440 RepID=A0A5J4VF98_9EUKA|nr:MAG: hypothetical protein EZS28_023316 [Streblomastix strix]
MYTIQYPIEFNISSLYRLVRVQLLVLLTESDTRITYPYVNQQILQMRESQKRKKIEKNKREFEALEEELNNISMEITQGLNLICYTNTTVSLLNNLNEQNMIYYQRKKQESIKRYWIFLYGQDQYVNPTAKSKKDDLLAPLSFVQFNPSSNKYKLNDQNQQKVTFSPSSSFYYDETALTTIGIQVFEASKRQAEFYLVRYVDEERGYALCLGI